MIGCIILPLYDCFLAYFSRTLNEYVKNVPELGANLMPTYLMWIIISLTLQTAFLAVLGFFAVACANKFLIQNFIYAKIIQFVLLIGVFIFMIVNIVRFNNLQGFGVDSYLDDNWPRIIKFIDMKEFDGGLVACRGGKYLQETKISTVFSEVECPVWPGYKDFTKRDFIAQLWELKDQGVLGTEETLYGCLNPECAVTLKSGLISNQFIMMFVILGLAFLNMFSIGLASHTIKFDIHYKNLLMNACVFVSLLAIIVFGVLSTALSSF